MGFAGISQGENNINIFKDSLAKARICPYNVPLVFWNDYIESIIMYAVIITGGKQYKVSEGDTLKVEKLDVEAGKSIDFNDVLMIGNDDDVTIGTPLIAKAKVKATIVSHGRGKKIKIIKFKRRKHHMKRMGHRQSYTEIEITGIAA